MGSNMTKDEMCAWIELNMVRNGAAVADAFRAARRQLAIGLGLEGELEPPDRTHLNRGEHQLPSLTDWNNWKDRHG